MKLTLWLAPAFMEMVVFLAPHPAMAQTDSIRIDADRSYTDSVGTVVKPYMEISCKPNADRHRLTVTFNTGLLAVGKPVMITVGDVGPVEMPFMTLEDRKTIMRVDQLPVNELANLTDAQFSGVAFVKGLIVLAFQPFMQNNAVGVAFDTSKILATLHDSHPACFQVLSEETKPLKK